MDLPSLLSRAKLECVCEALKDSLPSLSFLNCQLLSPGDYLPPSPSRFCSSPASGVLNAIYVLAGGKMALIVGVSFYTERY